MSIRTKVMRKSKSRAVLAKYEKQIEQVVNIGANLVRNTAVQSIHAHGSSGRAYGGHIASTAGNPPNTDTGYLANQIHVAADSDKMGASVESRAEYSAYLEFGTKDMDARPFLQPALEENKNKIKAMYRKLKARGL